MRDIVYFDLETRHSAAEVGGWHNTADMRVSVGVTYSTASGKYTIYSEEMVDDLIPVSYTHLTLPTIHSV